MSWSPPPAEVDAGTITLPDLPATFAFHQPEPGRLGLSLEQVALNSFTLRSRGFNWVHEYPYFT